MNQEKSQGWGRVVTAGLLGAGVMYLLDPQRGNRRRAMLRDKIVHYRKRSGYRLRKRARDLRNRTQGQLAELRRRREQEIPDSLLAERCRAAFGRVVSHPRLVEIHLSDGHVSLAGTILANEHSKLVDCLKSVSGVRSVESHLDEVSSEREIQYLAGRQGVRRAA